MKRIVLPLALCAFLVGLSFYSLRGESTIPDLVLDSLHLLKKPIEDLLPDLQEEPDRTNAESIQQASLDIDQYQDLKNNRERWNQMRALIEAGQPLSQPLPSEIAISTSPAGRLAPAVPPPPGFTVQLPYESRLTVSGRKTIGMTFRSTKYTNSNFANTQGIPTGQNSFELQQQLQVRINGQVGRKVTVNVDFDDTKEDKKDISIVYKGDPDEIVQRAAFGDINLSLPQTEFAGYSKQVFGASAELKYKAVHAYLIGSRTKGETETKEFLGNVILQRLNIPDSSYIRRRFYNFTQLSGGSSDKPVDVTTMRVYLDTQDVTRSSATFSPSVTTVDPTLLTNAQAYTGNFVLLASGIDYTVDPSSGVITFKTALTANAVVAIDYALPGTSNLLSNSRGTAGQAKILKYDETKITSVPITEELTHYNIGTTKIVRDNGQGNFILQLRDLGNNPIGASAGVQYLPNSSGQIVVDFEAGTFVLKQRLYASDPSKANLVYAFTPSTQGNFFVEFRSRVKTYTLRPNIVLNSERILLNGRVLTRDVDYFIDYESGFVTFFNEDQITEDSRIQATYDFSPFGIAGAQQDTLVGERLELSMAPAAPILASSLIGSTVIYDFAPKQTAAPDIRQTSGSFLVTEGDLHFKDLIFNPLPFLKSSFSGEVARSARNPNTFGKALIDNMEGIKDETSVNLSALSWQIASNPTVAGRVTYANAIGIVHTPALATDNLINERIRTLDINPNASALPGDLVQVLDINYDLTQSAEASIATTLSPSGIDFSKKLYVEMWVQGDGSQAAGSASGTQFNVSMGQISEDADGTAGGGFTDINGTHTLGDGTPRTEDLNRNNTLDLNEDIGWTFYNPDNTTTQIGVSNLHLDSEDLDRNGILDSANALVGGSVGYAASNSNQSLDFGGSGLNAVDHNTWKFVRVPLNISSTTAADWSSIKEMRISLKPSGSPGKRGTIRIAKLSVVGNRWEVSDTGLFGSTITVKAINNEDDAAYVSPAGNPDFDALNQINTALSGPTPSKRKEQALAIDYSFAAGLSGSSVTARSVTVSPMDFTPYGSLRFFLYGDASSGNREIFFFRAGTDTDYLEYSIPVTWQGWAQISIRQISTSGNQRPDTWADGAGNPTAGSVRRVGNPNLNNVAQLKVGVQNTSTGANSGELWFDELHAADVITRVGYASKLASDFEIFGWGTFGANVRDIDRNFETFTSAITNQDRHEENAYLTVSRLLWFPMRFSGLRRRTITPTVSNINNSTLVSVQQEGRVDERAFSSQGTLQIPRFPRVGLNYDTNKVETQNLYRTDQTDRYGATVDYSVPLQRFYLPKTVQVGYRITKLNLKFGAAALPGATDPFSVSNTKDDTRDITARMSFQPLPGFTFNPNYALSTTRESKEAIVDTATLTTQSLAYDKSKSQTVGFDGVLAFKRWISPRLRYTITNRETYGIPLLNDFSAARLKSVDRTATGEMAWDFAWRDFTRKARALQSLNVVSSYLIEDGDSWNNVAAGYNSLNVLTVRNSLRPGNSEAIRQNLTLRDTFRSTQRWTPFDWASQWRGAATPLRTLSLTSTYTDTRQRQETTSTPSRINTRIAPDLIFSLTQTEYFFHAQNVMSNSQMNIKTQRKTVDTVNTSLQKSTVNGGDWRFTLWRKLDLFFTYTRTSDNTFDRTNQITTNDASGEILGAQLGFNMGKWRFTPKYDQSKQKAVDASGRLTTDLTTRAPALQVYADLYLPAGLRLPFGDLLVFSNRIRTTSTLSLTQKRSSLNDVQNNTDTYAFTTSEDYEMTSNIRLTVGGSYSYTSNKASADANFYSYELNTLLTIQF